MHPSEKRRQGYLAYFKDGVYDALVYGQMDDIRRSSAYYKQGYDCIKERGQCHFDAELC